MKPGGVLLVVAGVWVLCQVLGGNALKRLGLDEREVPAAPDSAFGVTPPDRGYQRVPHDGHGRPL